MKVLNAVGGAGKIDVTGAEGKAVAVYSVAGQQMAAVNGDATINVPAGVYVVKVGSDCQKVMVK